ncbi:chymotrypsin-1-like [Pieris rapae]|uniref:chymotrypsin-1-like n=1 Tax=Pieris rapae TaxID=64459 RepID=UPI001E27A7B5|nr:chymotrypsin-1-like [Pieris rapae]XP_045488905.1 chymotrypsin-1-like [Pieris rapae]
MFLNIVKLFVLSWIVHGDAQESRIVGGTDAYESLAPYQVSLRRTDRSDDHFCAGSIISETWILTAAHCTNGLETDQIAAVVGTNKLSSGGDRYEIKQIIIHENFDIQRLQNDISLCQIKGEFNFNDLVKPITLASRTKIRPGSRCVLTGWGFTDNQRTVPDNLQVLTVTVMSNKRCSQKLAQTNGLTPIEKTQMCTLTRESEGACNGDSGGPLVRNGKQVGIVSWGIPCARGFPDVFAYVPAYYDWINEHIQ